MTKYVKGSIDNAASDAFIARAIDEHISSCAERGTKAVFYVNESNGIQALPILSSRGILARFCYIKSTHFEGKHTNRAICELPLDFLMSCAIGDDILVIDYGTRKDRSRAVYQGVPFLKYALDRIWLDREPDSVRIFPRSNDRESGVETIASFRKWFDLIGKKQEGKLLPFRDIARDNLRGTNEGVKLAGASAATTHDGDKLFYARIKRAYFENLHT